ncbi:uncharacterized protein [Struthio camelus]|uniref:uncharacterized protein isoform X6 n=1 Tax=Struthio camelus TaxID=8801 RepID=UPI003603E015
MGYREVGRAACLGCSPRMRVSLPPAAPPPAARAGCSSPSGAAFRALPRRCLMLLSPKVHSLPVCWQPRRMYEAAGNEQEVLLLCLEEEREQRRMRKRVRISPSRWSRCSCKVRGLRSLSINRRETQRPPGLTGKLQLLETILQPTLEAGRGGGCPDTRYVSSDCEAGSAPSASPPATAVPCGAAAL